MIQSKPSTQPESPLVRVFLDRDPKLDIVGLAGIPTDDATLHLSLCTLDTIVTNRVAAGWDADVTLAKVLVAMTSVAWNYAEGGECDYWGDLSEAIRNATRHSTELAEKANLQALLGGSFHKALKRFDYRAPDEVGQIYVGTILFHAGIPRPALPNVLSVVVEAYEQYGDLAINLDRGSRRCLAQQIPQTNVRRLLASNYSGADELWRCLARVVQAWPSRHDREAALRQLPKPALDAEEVSKLLTDFPALRERQLSLFDRW